MLIELSSITLHIFFLLVDSSIRLDNLWREPLRQCWASTYPFMPTSIRKVVAIWVILCDVPHIGGHDCYFASEACTSLSPLWCLVNSELCGLDCLFLRDFSCYSSWISFFFTNTHDGRISLLLKERVFWVDLSLKFILFQGNLKHLVNESHLEQFSLVTSTLLFIQEENFSREK